MRTSAKTLLFSTILVLFIAFSCSEGEPVTKEGPFNISELAGNWEATSAYFSSDDGESNIELIGEGGSVTMAIQSSGRFTMTVNPADRAAYTVGGEMFWEIWEGQYLFSITWNDYPDDWENYTATLTDTTLLISGSFGTGEYDFDNDGTPESTTLRIDFIRV
ncbi:MAG: hypothetical protein KJO16_04185 [Muriicola sp.]|nr:hypothetical protein [Muriicola sp.]NNK10591.1 hypothetical protein [Flavobacteriaceae bacterium]